MHPSHENWLQLIFNSNHARMTSLSPAFSSPGDGVLGFGDGLEAVLAVGLVWPLGLAGTGVIIERGRENSIDLFCSSLSIWSASQAAVESTGLGPLH